MFAFRGKADIAPASQMSANDPIGTNSLSPHDLFVLSSTQKILSQKIFQIRSRSCPVPSAVGTDPDVNVWVEGEARQQVMTVSIAVYKFAVIKMINPSRYIADFPGDCSIVRPSPL
jgi:hypothetical protein